MGNDHRVIQLTISGEAREVLIDELMMMHVMDNLISNSVKFSENQVAPEIKVTFAEDSFEINVRDFGIGIPDAEKVELFSSYFRGSNTAGIKGNGLGLVLVKNIIDLHDGDIELTSEAGKGTTIKLTIPC